MKKIDNYNETDVIVEKETHKLINVEINGKKYKVIDEDVNAVLVDVEIEDSNGNKKLQKQWYSKSKVE